jgi:hypothetical protein
MRPSPPLSPHGADPFLPLILGEAASLPRLDVERESNHLAQQSLALGSVAPAGREAPRAGLPRALDQEASEVSAIPRIGCRSDGKNRRHQSGLIDKKRC